MKPVVYDCLKQVLLVTGVYLIGNYNYSILWGIVPAVFLTIHKAKSKNLQSKRLINQHLNDDGEEAVLGGIADLPTWVYFPDFEKTEWLNKINQQLWPYVNDYAKDIVTDFIEPILKKAINQNTQFERIVLGSQPFRINGIKVHSASKRDEIYMDLELAYPGDCNIALQALGMKGGIRNFELYGKLRVVLKPLLSTVPFMGEIQAYFMEDPKINFDLFGIAQVLDTPGISDMIRQSISDQINATMVYPKKYTLKMTSEIYKEAGIQLPKGVIRVHLMEAKELLRKDIKLFKKGKSDPYAILRVGNEEYRSKTIDNTITPHWDEWFEFKVTEYSGQLLLIDLWDKDATDDEFLGCCVVDIEHVMREGEIERWEQLKKVSHGMLHLKVKYLPLTSDATDLENALKDVLEIPNHNINSAVLTVVVDSASNIPNVKNTSNPDPYVRLKQGKEESTTKTIEKTVTPIWEESFDYFIRNPTNERLFLTIVDDKTDTNLGSHTIDIKSLLSMSNLELIQHKFQLNNGVQLVLSLYLRLYQIEREEVSSVANSEVSECVVEEKRDSIQSTSLDPIDSIIPPTSSLQPLLPRIHLTIRYSRQRQRLIIVVHKVQNIPYKDPDNLPNTYVKFYLLPERTKESKRKTSILKNSVYPVFDETLEYAIAEADVPFKRLEVTVNVDKKLKNPCVGEAFIELRDIDLEGTISDWYTLKTDD